MNNEKILGAKLYQYFGMFNMRVYIIISEHLSKYKMSLMASVLACNFVI